MLRKPPFAVQGGVWYLNNIIEQTRASRRSCERCMLAPSTRGANIGRIKRGRDEEGQSKVGRMTLGQANFPDLFGISAVKNVHASIVSAFFARTLNKVL